MCEEVPLLLVGLDFRVLGGGCRGLGAATLMLAAVSPREGSYSSPELSLTTGVEAFFFFDFFGGTTTGNGNGIT